MLPSRNLRPYLGASIKVEWHPKQKRFVTIPSVIGVRPPPNFQFILGQPGSIKNTAKAIQSIIKIHKKDTAICAFQDTIDNLRNSKTDTAHDFFVSQSLIARWMGMRYRRLHGQTD